MLVLSRKIGESIHIGNGIVITVNRLLGNRVSLGIQAPTDVTIRRGELGELARSVGNADGLGADLLEADANSGRIDGSCEIFAVAPMARDSVAGELNRPQHSERPSGRHDTIRPGNRPLERTGHVKRALVRGRRPVGAR